MEDATFAKVYRTLFRLACTKLRQFDPSLVIGVNQTLTARWVDATILKAMARAHDEYGYLPYDSTYKAKVNLRIRRLVTLVSMACDGDRRSMIRI